MEAFQLLQVSPVQGPCLTNIEEAGENDRPVHLELRGPPDVVLAQDASLQAAKSLAGLADPGADLLVETPVAVDHTTLFTVQNKSSTAECVPMAAAILAMPVTSSALRQPQAFLHYAMLRATRRGKLHTTFVRSISGTLSLSHTHPQTDARVFQYLHNGFRCRTVQL